MESATPSPAHLVLSKKDAQNESGLFSSESVLNILRLIFAGAPLVEVLTIIAQLVESLGNGTLCTIWLPDDNRRRLHCAAAPSLPGFITHVGSVLIGPKGGPAAQPFIERNQYMHTTQEPGSTPRYMAHPN
jgi:formate hydrogenlyase transcriptional activator